MFFNEKLLERFNKWVNLDKIYFVNEFIVLIFILFNCFNKFIYILLCVNLKYCIKCFINCFFILFVELLVNVIIEIRLLIDFLEFL